MLICAHDMIVLLFNLFDASPKDVDLRLSVLDALVEGVERLVRLLLCSRVFMVLLNGLHLLH